MPLAKTKLSELGLAEIGLGTPVELVLRVTGTDSVVVPETTLIKPTETPVEVGAPAPMATVRTRGVVPDCGVTVSQLVSAVMDVRVTLPFPLATESRTVWVGVVTPVWVLNVSCGGEATTVAV